MITRPAPVDAPIAVFVHVHYPEIWAEMAPLLAARLTRPFRLTVTTTHPAAEIAIPKSRHMQGHRTLQVENRGRDILPFLTALATEPPFHLGLKLHTKKSPQREDGAQWRAAILDSLLPRRGAGRLAARIQADPRIGIVAPAGFDLGVEPWVLQNRTGMARVMAAVGHTMQDTDLEDAYFAAGSMFWFRHAALARLAEPAVLALFEPEDAQTDGTIAHAMERLFPVEAKRQGFVSLAVPALEAAHPDLPTPALLRLARQHADIPNTYFPAPYVEALPPPPAPPLPPLKALYARLPLPLRRLIRALRGG